MTTSIHDLPDECLLQIFRDIEPWTYLPLSWPGTRDHPLFPGTVHPLQCALVCRRWRSTAPHAVKSLTISTRYSQRRSTMDEDLVVGIARLSSLTKLKLRRSAIMLHTMSVHDFTMQLATSCPLLEELSISDLRIINLEQSDMTHELAPALSTTPITAWTSLRKLTLGSIISPNNSDTFSLLDSIRKAPSLDHVHIMVDLPGESDACLVLLAYFQRITHLRDLHINHCPPLTNFLAGETSLEPICESLLQLTSIQNLHVITPSVPTPAMAALTSLRHLELKGVPGVDWPDPETANGFLSLTSLLASEVTNLSSSVGSLSALRKLCIRDCAIQNLPYSLGNLHGLESLQIKFCDGLQTLPVTLGRLASLTSLDIGMCESFLRFPESLGSLRLLRSLSIKGGELVALPSSIRGLKSLVSLSLYCMSTEKLPEAVSGLVKLQLLTLRGCKALTKLPRGIGSLSQLRTLDASECPSLCKLPDTISSLIGLKDLDLHGCIALWKLPPGLGNLGSLLRLNLGGCRSLETLPEGVGRLESLQFLKLSGCSDMQLPPAVSQLTNLEELHMDGVPIDPRLHFPNGISALKNLRSLSICAGPSEESLLPSGFSELTELTTLRITTHVRNELEESERIEGLSQYVASFSSASAGPRVPLSRGLVSLPALRDLELRDCCKHLTRDLLTLPVLATLEWSATPEVSALPSNVEIVNELRDRGVQVYFY